MQKQQDIALVKPILTKSPCYELKIHKNSFDTSRYDVDFTSNLVYQSTSRRKRLILPEIKYEAQRHSFWYRSGFRANLLQQYVINIFEDLNIEPKLLNLIWSYFDMNWDENIAGT